MNGTNITSLECEVMDEICAADSRGIPRCLESS